MSDQQPKLPNRQTAFSEAFVKFIPEDWAPYDPTLPPELPAAEYAPTRRDRVSAAFPGDRIVIPAGGLALRANDTDFRFRPNTAFAHLTGLGTDREPDAVLVLEPTDHGHDATLYFHPRVQRTDPEFYASARYGEMWVGQRDSLEEMRARTGIGCVPIEQLDAALAKDADATRIRVLRTADSTITAKVDAVRGAEASAEVDDELEVQLSELRLCKDEFEAEQMREACRLTAVGFEHVVADLPEAVRRGRGERWVEGIFGLHARHHGNDVGYSTIAASGDHANTLHWIRNDGELRNGDLLLLDAGVETETLYTADITRTLPVSGRFTPTQRLVYDAVLEAQEAGIAAAQPGATFADIHAAAIAVVVKYLSQWDLLPVSPDEALGTEGGQQRRWMVHGTSHHLGMDVHDCAQARNENYREGTLRPGMVVTVEPGIYFKATDLLVPEEWRGIGVRIEDDLLITETGNEILSAALPRSADEVEAWMAPLLDGSRAPREN